MVNEATGVMEIKTSFNEVLSKLIQHAKNGGEVVVDFIPNSKHHGGKDMLVIHDDGDRKGDVSIWHIEMSEEGLFPYIFDDGVS